MDFLPKILIGTVLLFFLGLPRSVLAVTVASQTQSFSDQLVTHRALQELGNNLSGVAGSFTFRVSTSRTNLTQFDYVIQNTQIFDKDNNNSYIVPCPLPGHNPADTLGGLIFNTEGVPTGFEDVTIDFSCHNYSFIPGHRYLIVFASANSNDFSGLMLLAAAAYGPGGNGGSTDQFTGGGLRYSTGNKFDITHNSGNCSGIDYIWNDQTINPKSGCNIFSSSKDDLYFILKNTAPEPTPTPTPTPTKNPVIFIPGIGGSELKASQDIVWSKDNGHGGTFSHAYTANEKIWVNQNEAAKIGDDDYFDVLRLKTDGKTAEAALSLTGDLTSFGYGDIDSFFQDNGYVKGTNFFLFAYDWRKDVRETKDSLDSLVEEAKTKSGKSQVNIVAHSMGGLIARYYISDFGKAAKVGKLIELGVPHLGSVDALKAMMYGKPVGRQIIGDFHLGVHASEVKDVFQNLPSAFQLLPSKTYYDFYSNSDKTLPYPFFDERDIDNDKVTGSLNFTQIKNLLTNLGNNMTIFNFGEQFHDLDSSLNQSNGVKIYTIGGTGFDTIGQIHETWLIKWPIKLIPITDEIMIDGDKTVPIYSAIPKNNLKDLTGAIKIYYVLQKHSDMPQASGVSMQTVKSILEENDIPVEVKDQKIDFEGKQISVFEGELDLYDDLGNHTGLNDKGEIEINIPNTSFSAPENSKHAFIKKDSQKIKVKLTSKKKGTINTKIRHYKQDQISKTTIYREIPITETAKVEFTLDSTIETSPTLIFFPDSTKSDTTSISSTSEVSGSTAVDQTPPKTTIKKDGNTITLSATDQDSGVLKIEYSLDNGKTVKTYDGPFTITATGKTIVQVKAIDKLGNEEIPKEILIEIASSSSSSSSPSSSSSSSSGSSSSTSSQSTSEESKPTSEVLRSDSFEVDKSKDVLGISSNNPIPSAQLSTQNELRTTKSKADTILSGILMVSGGIVMIASLGLTFTFFKPTPK